MDYIKPLEAVLHHFMWQCSHCTKRTRFSILQLKKDQKYQYSLRYRDTSEKARELNMPRGNHAQSIASNGGQRKDKNSYSDHGYVVRIFVRAVLATKDEESTRAMAADGTTKVLVSPPPR